ncbi:MAG: hypothetical protein ABUK08_00390 [Candidatus Humimicrobiaceae bacterium]
MIAKATLNNKEIDGDLFINPCNEVLFYSAGKDNTVYFSPVRFHGTEEEYIKDQGLNLVEWDIVSTENPYGPYEQQCRDHALGIIDMDRGEY